MQNTECIILQFPTGRRLSPIEERLLAYGQGREWTLDDFLNVQKEEEELKGFDIVAFGNKQYNPQRYNKDNIWVNKALLSDGKGKYAKIWNTGERDDNSLSYCKESTARSLYHEAQTKLISWRTLFPNAKPRPHERKYIEEPLCENGSAPG